MKSALILLCFLSTPTYAFNYRECMDVGIGKAYFGGAVTSTTEFLSSWGACSMLGLNPTDQKRIFVAQNMEQIESDTARGEGQYLKTYASMSGCSDFAIKHLQRSFQQNFVQIYGPSPDRPAEQVYDAMEHILTTDPILKNHCILPKTTSI